MIRTNTYVGTPTPRIEDQRFLTGKGLYVCDLHRPCELVALFVRSPYPHGRIRAIDTQPALEIDGVVGVITALEFMNAPNIPLRANFSSLKSFAQPAVCGEFIRYVGEPVAVVVATNLESAHRACELIALEVDILDPVLDYCQAIAIGERSIGRFATAIAGTCEASRGDTDAAFSAAAYTRKETFRVHRHGAMPMETRGLIAEWDDARQHLTMHGAAKTPFFSRKCLASILQLSEHQVDYLEYDVGGGFGARGEIHPEDFLLAQASIRFRRPIRWVEDRQEHFICMNQARDIACELEIALSNSGEILGVRGTNFLDLGAYARPSCITAFKNVSQFMGATYRIPNFLMKSIAYLTNKTPSGVFRGPGRFESCFFFERLLDLAARDLGFDRLEIRRSNLLTSDEMPYKLAEMTPGEGATGHLDSGHYPLTLERCAELFDWDNRSRLSGQLVDGRWHGIGAACFVEGGASGPREHARVELFEDDTVRVTVGSSDLGQGVETVMAQIAADVLEVPIERIVVRHGSTDLLADGFGSSASRATVMGGSAVLLAAEKLVGLFREHGAQHLQCPFDQMSYAAGALLGPGNKRIQLRDLDCGPLTADGTFENDKATYVYGTAMAHVAVDPGTGGCELLAYQAVDDVGRAINPLTLHGQVIGAIVQGLGGTFSEEFVFNDHGQPLVGTFLDYVMPTAEDYPNVAAETLQVYPSPNNPLGAKGSGEGGLIPVAGAVGNAVADALSPLGTKILELPLSPCRLWTSMAQTQLHDEP